MKNFWIISLLCLAIMPLSNNLLGQNPEIDSLRILLQQKYTASDTNRVIALQKLAKLLYGVHPEEVKKIGEESLKISEEVNYTKGITNAYNIIGTAHMLKGEWQEAIQCYETCLFMAQHESYTDVVAACYYNIGIVKQQQHEYAEALKNYLKALRIREQLNDVKGIAHVYNSIGSIYSIQNDYKNALHYFRKYLEMSQQHKLERGVEHAYNNIGIVHRKMRDYTKALEYSFKALELRQKNGMKLGVSDSYLNIGGIYEDMKDFSNAIQYYQKALMLKKELSDNVGVGSALLNISSIYYQIGKFAEAENTLKESLHYSKQNQDVDAEMKIYLMLYQIDSAKKDYFSALSWYKKYHEVKDSLEKKHNLEMLAEIKTKFEADKKESQNKILHEEVRRKSVQNFTLFLGLMVVFVFSIYTYRNWQKLKETNTLLEVRNKEVDAQKEEIRFQSEKLKEAHEQLMQKNKELERSKEIILDSNKQITSSINYALYIQQAMLPRLREIREVLPDLFVFLKPRDIVSGDFYWFRKTSARPIFEEKATFKGIEKILIGFENEKILIAAADCTGHGVPGAFMSLIGNDLLNEIVELRGIYSPEKVLNELKIRITYALNQHETLNNDGMEIAICAIDKEANIVEYAGSKMPLVYIQNNELHRLKGDNILIGGLDKIDNFHFKKHVIPILSQTTFYMFSDGFQDQFGGEKRKKFKLDRLLSLFHAIHPLSMDIQQNEIQNTLTTWMGDEEQVDDILVIGFKLSNMNKTSSLWA